MSIFYSASAAGFYSTAIHGEAMPADVVPISAARHREMLSAQAKGATIVAGDDGRPRLHRPRATLADQRALAVRRVKREAARRIEGVSPIWRQLNDQRISSADGEARFAAIDAIRSASGAIETIVVTASADDLSALDILNHPAWPGIE